MDTKLLKNKEKFIELLMSIKREGSDIEGLIKWLEDRGFFESPATTQYHYSEEGGLCEHSLDVYYKLHEILTTFAPTTYSIDTEIILGLLHDIIRCTMYEKTVINEKVRDENGKCVDNLGRFYWNSKVVFKNKSSNDRNSFGNYAFNNYYMVSTFIPLYPEEVAALMSYDCGMSSGYVNTEVFIALDKAPLAVILQSADMLSSYLPKDFGHEQTY